MSLTYRIGDRSVVRLTHSIAITQRLDVSLRAQYQWYSLIIIVQFTNSWRLGHSPTGQYGRFHRIGLTATNAVYIASALGCYLCANCKDSRRVQQYV